MKPSSISTSSNSPSSSLLSRITPTCNMSSPNSSQSSEMVSNTPRLHWYSPTEAVPSFSLTVNFTLFPKFPAEIRHKIWAIASNELRNVDIWVRNLYITTVDDCRTFWAPYLLYTTAGVPSVLHASHESRTEALKYYTLDFGTRFKHDGHSYSSHELFPKFEVRFPPQIYINWCEDRICLMRPEAFQEYITVDGNETEEMVRYFLQNAKSTCLERLADVLFDNKDPKMTVDDVANSLNIRICRVTYSPLKSTQTNN